MPFNIDDFQLPRAVGFRVEVYDPYHKLYNSTLDEDGNMVSRDPSRDPDARACLDHFNWNSRRPGPFISMYLSWDKARGRRSWYLKRGATHVVITAVWLKGLSSVYDAYGIAASLGIRNEQLEWHLGEVLVLRGIWADQYRILATFDGVGEPRRALLSVNGFRADALLPPAFIEGLPTEVEDGVALPNATDRLRDEIYSYSGEIDGAKLCTLVIALSGYRPTPWGSLTIKTLPPGESWPDSVCFRCMSYEEDTLRLYYCF